MIVPPSGPVKDSQRSSKPNSMTPEKKNSAPPNLNGVRGVFGKGVRISIPPHPVKPEPKDREGVGKNASKAMKISHAISSSVLQKSRSIEEKIKSIQISEDKLQSRMHIKEAFAKYSQNGDAVAGRAFRRHKGSTSAGPQLRRARRSDKKTHEPQLLVKLTTVMITHLYQQCNPKFNYKPSIRPRRALSKPSKPVSNSGHDNSENNLIMFANDILHSETGPIRSFRVEEMLGKGTFGQVVKAEDLASRKKVAVKVIKNKPAYYNQAVIEIEILTKLNRKYDPDGKYNIVRLLDHFVFKNHLCLAFELLSVNLYELIKQNRFRGLSCNLIRTILKQILRAVSVLETAGIIHCDIKPENILLTSLTSATIKLIDFGSACKRMQTIYSYIQSRFYRSPEVLLGLPYDMKIDMWSVGCVGAELFLGLPLFPGVSAFNQVYRIVEMLGVPQEMLRRSKKSRLFFDHNADTDTYRIKSISQYAEENKTKPVYPKRYFKATKLDQLLRDYPYRSTLSSQEKEKEQGDRELLSDLLCTLLQLHPHDRTSPSDALCHAFIVGGENNSRSARPKRALDFTRVTPKKRTSGFNVTSDMGSLTSGGVASHGSGLGMAFRQYHNGPASGGIGAGFPPPLTGSQDTKGNGFSNIHHQIKQSCPPPINHPQHHPPPLQHQVMISPGDMSFTNEMADHTPIAHTPLQRAMAHSHSLTLASTPMRGSPHRAGGGYLRDVSPSSGIGGSWGSNPPSFLGNSSPALGSTGDISFMRNSPVHRNSPLHIGSSGSPLRGSPLRSAQFRNSSPMKGGSPVRSRGLKTGGGMWIPGPRLRGANSGQDFYTGGRVYGSPPGGMDSQSYSRSWGHNNYQQSLLMHQGGVMGTAQRGSLGSFEYGGSYNRSYGLDEGKGNPFERPQIYRRRSAGGPPGQHSVPFTTQMHNYPPHGQVPRYTHHSPFKNFQPPLRNVVRHHGSGSKDRGKGGGKQGGKSGRKK
ncbi:hypothetical protein AAMO2058_001079400 [Amorphochlora amoebiformis]|mmetsp:Transcript_35056/g.56597  ORF Transcript_35056/g.56597 Transcript_35056/m.56597 type:complete len:976 (-) Transcript_35056:124-3051(-)